MADKVVYFTGCFANYYEPGTGRSLVAVMEKNGIEVLVPEQKCCGMPMMANGNRRGAAENFLFNVQSLARAASAGYQIVTTCPSCNIMLRKDGLKFFDCTDARFVAGRVYDAGEYLFNLHLRGRLNRAFGPSSRVTPLPVFYHNPCHLQVQDILRQPIGLLKLVPGLLLVGVNRHSCGMGGSYGLKKAHFERSVKIAQKVWREVKDGPAEVVTTECGGCGLQIQAGTGARIRHPLTLLDQAYKGRL